MINSVVVMTITIKENILMTFRGTWLIKYSEYNKTHFAMFARGTCFGRTDMNFEV